MCELCSGDLGRAAAEKMADRLTRLAADYRNLSAGRVKPHTEATKAIAERAKTIVRYLVDEWI